MRTFIGRLLKPYPTRCFVASSLALLMLAGITLTFSGCAKKEALTSDADSQAFEGNDEANQHLHEAQRLIRKGDFENAFLHLNKALAIRPNDLGIHRDMGWLYLYTDQPEKATDELQRLEKSAPDAPETDYLAGGIYNYLEKPRDAVKYYTMALKGSPSHPGITNKPELYFDLATSLNGINEPEQALEYLEKGFPLTQKPKKGQEQDDRYTNFLFALCSTHYSLGHIEKALDFCKQASDLTEDPKEKETITDYMEKMKLLQAIEAR